MAQKQSVRMTPLAQMKSWLRKYSLNQRSKNMKRQHRWSAKICARVLKHSAFLRAKNVAVYLGFGSEVLTDRLVFQSWKQGKTVLVPDTKKGLANTVFYTYEPNDRLIKTSQGMKELKQPKNPFPWNKIDVVIVPGVAFDKSGHRLGYGGGTYDRILRKTKNAILMGLFFENQILTQIPTSKFDVKMNTIVTERGVIPCLAK